MKYLLVLTSIIGSSAFAAENQTTLCNFGDQQRKIEVIYPENGENACEVQYTKNNSMKVLWTARSDKGYCQEKATAFIEKQQGWGWQCDSQIEDTTDVKTEPAVKEIEPEPAEPVENPRSEEPEEPEETEETEIK